MKIVPQSNTDVKCAHEGCEEVLFREGLCWEHFIQEEAGAWDVQDTERRVCLEEGMGHIFDGPDSILDLSWWGYSLQEVSA